MVEPGDNVSVTIRREFGEEALGSMDKSEEEVKEITAKVEELFKHGKEASYLNGSQTLLIKLWWSEGDYSQSGGTIRAWKRGKLLYK